MRHFHSYGPVNSKQHICVPRTELIERCVSQLVGEPEEGGHFFTIWAPRQAGKTWLMQRAMEEIRLRYGDRFAVGALSMQAVSIKDTDPPEVFFQRIPHALRSWLGLTVPPLSQWGDFGALFQRGTPYFDRPLILLIDEFDRLPPAVIDELVTQLRDLYLNRASSLLHGLALIGVRAVLGFDSDRGSPFNVQRSLHVPNLTVEEVRELFRQYQAESGQLVDPAVVDKLHESTRGQPGLVGWFGELLTEKYNPGPTEKITMAVWEHVYRAACQIEMNNTVLNLVKKARGRYHHQVLDLFRRPDVPFSPDQEWCNYLYLNGIIDSQVVQDAGSQEPYVCRFSSPFVQLRLYNALALELLPGEVPALEPLDDIKDVFLPAGLDLPALLRRYAGYLARLKARGQSPFRGQPRRHDLQIYEAVGHFHLYAWLREVIGKRCVITPEFPTGNGKVDLHVRFQGHRGLIEIKSFGQRHELQSYREQTARYGVSQGLGAATLVLFVQSDDQEVLEQLSGEDVIDGVRVTTVAIGWG